MHMLDRGTAARQERKRLDDFTSAQEEHLLLEFRGGDGLPPVLQANTVMATPDFAGLAPPKFECDTLPLVHYPEFPSRWRRPGLEAAVRQASERGVWFHVDGAYGGFAAITERGRAALVGIELADSVTLDPHKWLYQPFECGCLLVRKGRQLLDAFEIHPDYLRDTKSAVPREVNFADYGMQLSRASHAIKVWLSIQ